MVNDEVDMIAEIRKLVVQVDEIHSEMGRAIEPATRRAVAMAVIANPFAGRYADNLESLSTIGEELGQLLGARCVTALGIRPDQAHSYGKAAIVGEAGELEHAAAILHPKMGAALRHEVSSGAALVPSAKKMGGLGTAIDVPLGHKDAAFVRSHFDAIEARVSDAPRAHEILVAIAVTDSGRPLARVGGLQAHEIQGKDGLR
jgi:Amino acid synthesis